MTSKKLAVGGPEITRVGFGAWAIGGDGWSFGWGPQNDIAAVDAMKHAVRRGINWIDTAAVYGLGHSEELVGTRAARPGEERAAAGLHEMWAALGQEESDGGAEA
jgi:aryl-alcohol dehydrogenase-like predicted oxidoreductase